MPTRNVVLTERHERFIADLVNSGRYQNALRDAARIGFDDLDRGCFRDIAESDLETVIGALGRIAE